MQTRGHGYLNGAYFSSAVGPNKMVIGDLRLQKGGADDSFDRRSSSDRSPPGQADAASLTQAMGPRSLVMQEASQVTGAKMIRYLGPLLIPVAAAGLAACLAAFFRAAATPSGRSPGQAQRALQWSALIATIATSAYVLFGPLYSSGDSAFDRDRTDAVRAVLIPVVLAAIPFAGRQLRSRLCLSGVFALLIAGFCVIAGFSIGMFYIPAAILAVAAAVAGIVQPSRARGPAPATPAAHRR